MLLVWLQEVHHPRACAWSQVRQAEEPRGDSQAGVRICTEGQSVAHDWATGRSDTVELAAERVVAEEEEQDPTGTADVTAVEARWDAEQAERAQLHSLAEEHTVMKVPRLHCHIDLAVEAQQ